jgi:ABC-type transport system substrate-binding protein
MFTILRSMLSLSIIAKESETDFDLRQKAIGTGPWQLTEYERSIRYVYKRHLNYFDKNLPYMDEIVQPVVPEYAAGLAQFVAGNVYSYPVRADDILATKRQVPVLALYQDDLTDPAGLLTHFGWEPNPPDKTPFRDERVRQAYSLSWDRDLFIETFFNVAAFESEGFPMETAWHTQIAANFPYKNWWLDPQGKEFGENGKYYQHNLPEAKKLLAAAGFAGGGPQVVATVRASDDPRRVAAIEGMASEAGFKFTPNVVETAEYMRYRDGQGHFQGIAYRGIPTGISSGGDDPLEYFIRSFSLKLGGRNYSGFDPAGKGDFSGDPYLEDILGKGRGEPNEEKRRAIVHDAQRYLGKMLYYIRWPGAGSGFLLRWPVVQNVRVYRDDRRGDEVTLWLDPSRPPVGSA